MWYTTSLNTYSLLPLLINTNRPRHKRVDITARAVLHQRLPKHGVGGGGGGGVEELLLLGRWEGQVVGGREDQAVIQLWMERGEG